MNIYKELDVIDRFEERCGNRTSVTRACDLMASYLANLRRPLPALAAQGLRTALKYKNGSIPVQDLESDRKAIATFLKDRLARTDPAPEYAVLRGVEAILSFYQNPVWGRRLRIGFKFLGSDR